jgi:hypothetical protein
MKRAFGWIGVVLLMWVLYPVGLFDDAVERVQTKWRNRKVCK